MQVHLYQNKSWVTQGDLARCLGVDRHKVELETRQPAFNKKYVRVLGGNSLREFLGANRLKRAGGRLAIIERHGAQIIEQRFRNGQLKLPFTDGRFQLDLLTKTFRGESLAFLEINGHRCLPATVLGKMLGYENPSELTNLIRIEWNDEFESGWNADVYLNLSESKTPPDYALLSGEILNDFKVRANSVGTTSLVGRNARHLLVLFEPGVHKVLLKTGRPAGVAVRDFLAKEVMPKLAPLVQPKNFFLNEQHELPAKPTLDFGRPAASGMVTGGLSDHGAERLHQAITLNTSYALADKLVHAGRLTGETALTVQIALVKEFGGVDIMARAGEVPKTQVAVTPKPETLPIPKRELLTKTIVAEEPWTLATTDEETYALGHAAQELRKETGRPVTAEIIKMLAGKLGIHIHYDTKPRSRTSAGVPYIRVSDYFKVRRYLAENPTVLPQQLS